MRSFWRFGRSEVGRRASGRGAVFGARRGYGTRAGAGGGAGRDSVRVVGCAGGDWLWEISAAMPIDVAPTRTRTGIKKSNMPSSYHTVSVLRHTRPLRPNRPLPARGKPARSCSSDPPLPIATCECACAPTSSRSGADSNKGRNWLPDERR